MFSLYQPFESGDNFKMSTIKKQILHQDEYSKLF